MAKSRSTVLLPFFDNIKTIIGEQQIKRLTKIIMKDFLRNHQQLEAFVRRKDHRKILFQIKEMRWNQVSKDPDSHRGKKVAKYIS